MADRVHPGRTGRKTVSPTQREPGSKAAQYLTSSVLTAAELVGNPKQRGGGGLKGYMEFLAVEEPDIFARLLAEALPLQEVVDYQAEGVNRQERRRFLIEKLFGC